MGNDAIQLPHNLTLKDRKMLALTGVTEVVSFDDSTVIVTTRLGTLVIQGQQLRLKDLTLEGGQVAVDGQISALIYEQPRPDGWLRRFLR